MSIYISERPERLVTQHTVVDWFKLGEFLLLSDRAISGRGRGIELPFTGDDVPF